MLATPAASCGPVLFPGGANLLLEPRVQPLSERLLPIADGGLARAQLPFRLGNGQPFRRRLLPLPLELAQVVVHSREMFGKLLFAFAEILARGRNHRLRHAEPGGDLNREAAAW